MGLTASIAVHTALIGGAVAVTASAKSRDRRESPPPLPQIIYTRHDHAIPPHRSRTGPARGPRVSSRGFVPPDLRRSLVFFPDSLLRRAVDIDAHALFPLDTGPVCSQCAARFGPDGTVSPSDAPATVATVDRAATLLSPARPTYPEVLRRAGVSGRVVVRLVVDTLGRVEPGTVAVRESSHDLFAGAVHRVLLTLRFVPAEAGGRKVRMLVDLPFEFRLDR